MPTIPDSVKCAKGNADCCASEHTDSTLSEGTAHFEQSGEHSVEVLTFGCRLNLYESEVIRQLACESDVSNTVIVNTCAVTAEAERQARQAIRKLHRENPKKAIVVTGCSAQINPTPYLNLPGVTRVLGNHEKLSRKSYVTLSNLEHPVLQVGNIADLKDTAPQLVSGFEGKARAFVQVQNGCDHRCTFCTIPYGRGPSRSVALGPIVDQCVLLLDQGYAEIVLTGVDITSYGNDLPGTPTLGQMVQRLLHCIPKLQRLRLSSLDPSEIDAELLESLADPRVLPYIHLSVQAGDDVILKRMKRRHLRHQIISCCDAIRSKRSDCVLGADLIAGFPTETEEMFLNTHSLIEACELVHLHVFPYSPRPGTPAARMPQTHQSVRAKRARLLRDAGHCQFKRYLEAQRGTVQTVLVESSDPFTFFGKTDGFVPIRGTQPTGPSIVAGACVHLRIHSIAQSTLVGALV
jgi:threonylcarbamoyladenosine tRNA methylthiotransferase MtaB